MAWNILHDGNLELGPHSADIVVSQLPGLLEDFRQLQKSPARFQISITNMLTYTVVTTKETTVRLLVVYEVDAGA